MNGANPAKIARRVRRWAYCGLGIFADVRLNGRDGLRAVPMEFGHL